MAQCKECLGDRNVEVPAVPLALPSLPVMVKCPKCDGTGEVKCGRCNDDGTVPNPSFGLNASDHGIKGMVSCPDCSKSAQSQPTS